VVVRRVRLRPHKCFPNHAVVVLPNDPYYSTPQWHALRNVVLHRDRYTCVVPGCNARAVVVDHIVPRKHGGMDLLSNLRSLCRTHDNKIKERMGGYNRGNEGKLRSPCDVNGMPLDPSHPWFRAKAKM
jgi:hypothetical protein